LKNLDAPFYLKSLMLGACFALLLASCAGEAGNPSDGLRGGYPVDALFRDFYPSLGGADVMGPAISPLFKVGEISYQYTVAGLMAHDPAALSHERFSMAAIGLDMGIQQLPYPAFEDPNLRYVAGHTIDPAFVPVFDRLDRRIVGEPITEARYNPDLKRIEQYFSNLGFYRLEGDPPGAVYLLAYGLWKCQAGCFDPGGSEAEVSLPYSVDPRFAEALKRLGTHFTGFPVSKAYTTPEGYIEQVFENVVLLAGAQEGEAVILRPITERLEIDHGPLVGKSDEAEAVFVAIDEAEGRHIPQAFWDFLALHGGLEVSGPPIDDLARVGAGVFRQCYTNLCLEEHRNEAGSLRIRPASLGYVYAQLPLLPLNAKAASLSAQPAIGAGGMQPAAPTRTPAVDKPLPPLTLQAWVQYPSLAAGQRQEVFAQVIQGEAPLPGVEPDLLLTLPDNTEIRYYMYPTGADGVSQYYLEPLDVNQGRTVRFQVCVYNQVGKRTCVQDSFEVQRAP